MFASSLLLTLALALPANAARHQAIEVMNDGVRLARQGSADSAEKALREATTLDSGYAYAWLNLGNFYRKQGRLAEAEAAFESGVKVPDAALRGELNHRLGTTILERSRAGGLTHAERTAKTKDAIVAFQAAANADPWRARAHYAVGQCHQFLEQPAKADAAYRHAIEADPRYSAPYTALGLMYIDYGFSNVGLVVLETVVTVNDASLDAWNGMGRAKMKLGHHREAVDAFKKALAIDPGALDVLYGLGMAHAELREREQAIERLQKFIESAGPDVPEHHKKAALNTIARMQDVI